MAKNQSYPKALDLEEAILGAMIVDSKSPDEVIMLLKSPDIFYKAEHRYIYGAILSLYHKKQAIDMLTIEQELRSQGVYDQSGGDVYLMELANVVSSSAHIEHHARLLMQFWVKRQLIDFSNKVRKESFDEKSDALDLLHDSARELDAINEILNSGRASMTYADALDAVEKRVELISSQGEHELTGITSGIEWIDKFTGGWQRSNLIIEAARPGMGKTARILKNMVECGLQNIPCGMFSLEMSIQQLAARTVSINSNFHLSQLIRDGFQKDSYFPSLRKKKTEMQKFPIYIDDMKTDILDIVSQARIWKRKHDIQILFVDYLQLVENREKGNNREQEISSISRTLKKLSKELDIPVIALSQLSRKVEERGDKRPKLSDLRESGAIEQDADVITFHYRESYYNDEAERPFPEYSHIHKSEFIFAKNRQGSLGFDELYIDMNKVKFIDPKHFSPYAVPTMDPDDEPF